MSLHSELRAGKDRLSEPYTSAILLRRKKQSRHPIAGFPWRDQCNESMNDRRFKRNARRPWTNHPGHCPFLPINLRRSLHFAPLLRKTARIFRITPSLPID